MKVYLGREQVQNLLNELWKRFHCFSGSLDQNSCILLLMVPVAAERILPPD